MKKLLLIIITHFVLLTGTLFAQPTVQDVYIDNSGLNPKLVFDFSESMNNSTFNSTNIKVHSSFAGYVSGTYSTSGEYSIELSRALFAGEEFIVTLSTGVQNSSNVGLAAPVAESVTYGADDGSGSFEQTARYQTEDNPNHVISADVNKDGYADVAVMHQGSELVSIRVSNGDGTFGAASTYSVGSGLHSYGATFGDVDGDGYIDLLVTTNSYTDSFVLFTNDGDGTFTNAGSFVFSGSSTYLAENVELVDLDADGDLDLFASFNFTNDGGTGSGAGRMLNDGTGSFSSPSAAGFAFSDQPDALATGDFDNDGDIDVAVGLKGSDQIRIYFNNGSGNMFSSSSTLSQDVDSPRALSALDIDKDGDLDLAVANHDNNNVLVFENTGAAGGTAPFFYFPDSYSTGASTFPIDISSGDVDSDGDHDLIVLVSGDVRIMNSDGAGNFSFGNSYSVSSYDYYLTTSDFNGDETIDFATAAGSTIDSLTVFQGLLLPEITSSAASSITTNSATLNGSINAKGNTVDAKFAYKLSSSGSYADTVVATPSQVTGSSSAAISANLTGLSPNTSYDFKALGFSAAGDVEGSETTFTTSDGSPVVSTGSATDVTQTTVTLNGTVNALNSSTTAYFEYGTSSGFYSTQINVAENPVNDGENVVAVTAAVTGLTAGTTYYYRLVGTNSGGTTNGSEGSFSTSNPVPTVTSTTPASNAFDIDTDASIDITFSEQMLTSSISTSTIKVAGSLTGSYSGTVTNSGNTATFDPTEEFFPGEIVTVTVTTGAESNTYNESLAQAYNFSFEVSAEAGFGSFAATTEDYSTGSSPHEVAVGDFNNDGFMDVVSTNQNANTISVNINDGDGTFASSANYATGTFVQGVKVGDLDGDGNLDIAVTHISSGVVGVFINSGTGTFGSMVSYSSGTGQDLEIFDVDGDGDPDIVQTGSGIKVLANNGDGTFASAVTYGSDSGWGITSGDFDGDGAIDVVTSDYSGQAIRVYLNNGDGTFASATAYSAGMSTSGIKTADIDNDGDLDVLVTNYQSDNIGVYLNNGDGTLASATTTSVSDGPYDLDIADIDGDGDLDVAISFQPLDKISIMYNDGSGNLGTPQDESSGDNPRGIALADLNGDNSIDVTTANNFGDNISVLKKEVPAPQVSSVTPTQNAVDIAKSSNITVTFDVPISTGTLIADNISVVGLLHGEYSGSVSNTSTSITFDPSQDFEAAEEIIVTVGTGVQNVEGTAMENPYTFSFIAGSKISDGLFRAASGITSASNTIKMLTSDFDADNDTDLLTFYDTGGFYYYANDGSGGFASVVSNSLASGNVDDAILIDIDLDGDLDILGAHNSLGRISRIFNDGDGTFSSVGNTTSSGAIAVSAGDIDRDGYPDAIVANQGSNEISVLINNQSGGFFQAGFGGSATYSAGTSPNEINVGDFDNDGDLDVVSSNSGSGNASVFLNNGDGTLAAAANYAVGTTPSAVSSADVDGDGYADLLVSNSATDNVSVLINDGDGTFATAVNYTVGDAPSAVNPVDIDGDGDIDLLVANADSDNLSLLSNNGDGTFAGQVNYAADDQPTDILAFDYDGDGDLDIFTSNYAADNVTILKRTGGPAVLEVAPTANAHFVPADSNITVKFNSVMSAASLTSSSIIVNGSLTGKYAGSVSYSDSVAIFDPSSDFASGEKITVTVTTGVEDSDNENMEYAYSWSFTTASTTAAVEWTNANLSGVSDLEGIVSADLDGDGDNDLVVSETEDSNISVFLNNGSGSFASAVDYNVGDYPNGVQVADVDNDGDVDLAVANSSSSNISVLINNGGGTFASTVNYSLNSGPNDLRVADIDGDGYADLVATYGSSSTTSILINDGDGTFGTAVNYSGSGMISGDLEIIDMDDDGAPEIVKRSVYNGFPASSTTILIWKNVGGGVFSDRTTYSISGSSSDLYVADVDKDGYPDIAYADNANDQVNIFINNGDGTIPTTASSTISVGDNPQNLTGGDFDGDGDIDIATANNNSNNVSLILNNGNGTFGTASSYSGNSNQSDITAADIDGDGQIDLAVAHSNGINLLTPLQAPSTSVSNVNFSNNYGIQVRTGWSNGNGNGRIVVMKQGSAVDFTPSDNTEYTANSSFGSGTELGSGNYVVYSGTGSNVTVSNLTMSTDYYVKVFEYNSDNSIIKYKTTDPGTGNVTTVSSPTSQAEFDEFTDNYGEQITASFSRPESGEGTSRILVMKQGSAVDQTPVDNTTYTADAEFGTGTDLGNGNYVIYKEGGFSGEVTVSGLTTGTVYHVAAFEYNGNVGGEAYNTTISTGNTGNITTNSVAGFPYDTTAGHAAFFEGPNSSEDPYAELNTDIALTDSFTVELWVKPDSIGQQMTFMSAESSSSGDGVLFNLEINASGNFTAAVLDSTTSSSVSVTGSTVASEGNWYHVALSGQSDDAIKLYVNGTLEASSSIHKMAMNGNDAYVYIGDYEETNYFFGDIDELRIWQSVRNESEIRANKRTALTGFPENLYGYWQFNDQDEGDESFDIYLIQEEFQYLTFVESSVPFGGTSNSAEAVQSGTISLGDFSLSLSDDFDNPVDVTVTEVSSDPNSFPEGYVSSIGGKLFIIELFGNPGTFSADLTLNYGAGNITSAQESDPSTLKLFKRESNSTGSWIDQGGASTAIASSGLVTWTGITSFSQFVAVGDDNLKPPVQTWTMDSDSLVFTKVGGADWTLSANQDCLTDDVCITRGNNKGIFNIAGETQYQGSDGDESVISPVGTKWAAGTTADLESLTFDTWLQTIINDFDYTPPNAVGENMVLYLEEENIYVDIKFTSWGQGSGGGGSFSYVRGAAPPKSLNIQRSDSSNVIAYTDSAYSFDSGFFDLTDGYEDSTITINSKSTLNGNLYLDKNSNGAYDGGTDDLLTANSPFAYTPSGSTKLMYSSSTAGFESAVIKLAGQTSADSVTINFYTLEASPSLAGNNGENGWYLLSNPVDSTIGMLLKNIWTQGAINSDAPSGDATIYTFSQDNSQYEAVTTDLDTTKLTAGEGLLVYIYEDDDILDGQSDIDGGWPKTLTNYGNPFGTDVSIPVKNVNHDGVAGTTGSEGFVLMGNPYGWPLSADSVIATIKREDPLANSYVYRWKPVEKVYELASTGAIDPYESFFVRVVTSGTNASLNFDYEDAAISTPAKQVNKNPFEITLTHSESKLESSSFIRLDEKGDTKIDPFDGYYLGTYASKFANLYTLIGDQPLTINNLPIGWEGELEYPIYMHATEKGDFSIKWDKDGLPEDVSAVLKHVESGDKISLTSQDSYTFKMNEVSQYLAGNEEIMSYQSLSKEKIKGKIRKPVFILIISSSLGTANENDLGIPTEVELYQNYPNPFNPTSIIRFGVPEASKVKLEIFDVLGRRVMTLLNNENKTPGRYNVQFDARSLSSGLYIYRLVVGDKVMTKKMTLIK